jgi:3-methyladenine DNA glycosylase Mpg
MQGEHKNDPQSVLIRAVEPLDDEFKLKTNGPGNLCKALRINISLNNVDMIKSEEI